MSNHFHALGFPVDEADDLDRLIHLASAEGDRFPSEHGEYCRGVPERGFKFGSTSWPQTSLAFLPTMLAPRNEQLG